MTIYESVTKLAAEKGMTIEEVECVAGLKKGTIEKWRMRKPKMETVLKVADALHEGITVIVSL